MCICIPFMLEKLILALVICSLVPVINVSMFNEAEAKVTNSSWYLGKSMQSSALCLMLTQGQSLFKEEMITIRLFHNITNSPFPSQRGTRGNPKGIGALFSTFKLALESFKKEINNDTTPYILLLMIPSVRTTGRRVTRKTLPEVMNAAHII